MFIHFKDGYDRWRTASSVTVALMIRAVTRKWNGLPTEDPLIAAFEIGRSNGEWLEWWETQSKGPTCFL